MEEKNKTLLARLLAYEESDVYPFHMPGHKRQMRGHPLEAAYGIDITEVEGFDDLHHAEGILKEAQQEAAEVFGAQETHFLINGSTGGILAAVCAAARKGERLLLARNCHKSVYHAVLLQELEPVYLYPKLCREADVWDGLTADAVGEALEREEKIAAVVITSPTYEGVVSDIPGIAAAAHAKGIPLIVDAAHGAHFGFHPAFPESPVRQGADAVIQSVHKTLPAFTQTALLHVNGELIDRKRLNRYLDIFQSSSPSYLFMSGIEECVRLLKGRGSGLWDEMFAALDRFYGQTEALLCLNVRRPAALQKGWEEESHRDYAELCGGQDTGQRRIRPELSGGRDATQEISRPEFDPSRLVISTRGSGMSGKALYECLLERYHLQLEMAGGTYVVAIVTMNDTKEGLERLTRALTEIDAQLAVSWKAEKTRETKGKCAAPSFQMAEAAAAALRGLQEYRPQQVSGIAAAADAPQETEALAQAVGGICAAYVNLYPPGTPLLAPGERITEETQQLLESYLALDFPVRGLVKERDGKWSIPVLKKEPSREQPPAAAEGEGKEAI